MKNFKIALLFVFLTILPLLSIAQCREFTEEKAIPLLGDYILSGRYHSLKLTEGEEILIFKTVNRGLKYRFIIIGAEELPKNIEMKITDWNDVLIYNNKDDKYNNVFDFENKKTQRIKIYIYVPKPKDNSDRIKGCVGLVIGFKNEK